MDKKFLILFLLAATACVTEMEYKPISLLGRLVFSLHLLVKKEQFLLKL
jgi:hypothetical protein